MGDYPGDKINELVGLVRSNLCVICGKEKTNCTPVQLTTFSDDESVSDYVLIACGECIKRMIRGGIFLYKRKAGSDDYL